MWVCLVDGKVEENSGAIDFSFFWGGGGWCYVINGFIGLSSVGFY